MYKHNSFIARYIHMIGDDPLPNDVIVLNPFSYCQEQALKAMEALLSGMLSQQVHTADWGHPNPLGEGILRWYII